MEKSKNLLSALRERNLTLACAESCTGGYLSYLLTKTPGSSKVFKGGVIVYSLEAKNIFLGLNTTSLQRSQGVSAQTAKNLARQVRARLKSSLGLSVVGVAGPDKVKAHPVGTVFIALADAKTTLTKQYLLKGGRDAIRKTAAKKAMEMIDENIHRH